MPAESAELLPAEITAMASQIYSSEHPLDSENRE
jgi:hypothetical protein